MALANIKNKYVTVARQHARDNSNARKNGESIFYKRYGKRYHLIAVYVTQKQRAMRDLFAEAVRMAKEDMTKWNRVRHWSRQARKHHIIGAYRAAVSCYYKLIKKQGNDIKEMKRVCCKIYVFSERRISSFG